MKIEETLGSLRKGSETSEVILFRKLSEMLPFINLLTVSCNKLDIYYLICTITFASDFRSLISSAKNAIYLIFSMN